MQALYIASVLAAAVTASPAPQPTLKTIVTVHSSQFCTALEQTVRPALAGLMQNDQLIERGRSVFHDAGNRIKYGGVPDGGGYHEIAGPPEWSPSSGDTMLVESRQRALAKSIEDNVDAIDTLLSDKKRFDAITAGDEKAKLLAIASQLNAIVAKQHTAVNIISGQVEGAEMADLFNRDPSWGGADATHGVTPLQALQAGHGSDWQFVYNVWQAATESKVPFYDPYDLFTRALVEDQSSIATAEGVASKSIFEAAGGCK
jgi:hypothetical protein